MDRPSSIVEGSKLAKLLQKRGARTSTAVIGLSHETSMVSETENQFSTVTEWS